MVFSQVIWNWSISPLRLYLTLYQIMEASRNFCLPCVTMLQSGSFKKFLATHLKTSRFLLKVLEDIQKFQMTSLKAHRSFANHKSQQPICSLHASETWSTTTQWCPEMLLLRLSQANKSQQPIRDRSSEIPASQRPARCKPALLQSLVDSPRRLSKCEDLFCVGVFDLQMCRPRGGYLIGVVIHQTLRYNSGALKLSYMRAHISLY